MKFKKIAEKGREIGRNLRDSVRDYAFHSAPKDFGYAMTFDALFGSPVLKGVAVGLTALILPGSDIGSLVKMADESYGHDIRVWEGICGMYISALGRLHYSEHKAYVQEQKQKQCRAERAQESNIPADYLID